MARHKVNVVGWYNKRNAGDESYKLSFPALFDYDFEFSERIKSGFDAYVLGGGDIVAPAFLKQFAKIEAPRHLMSVAFPEKINFALDGIFRSVLVRDNASLANAKGVGLDATLVPDFAFALKGDAATGREMIRKTFDAANAELYEKIVGVVLNAHLMSEHDGLAYNFARFERFCFELAMAADHCNASFLFIPFGKMMPWDDRAANATAVSRCKFFKKNVCLYEEVDAQATLDIIAALDCLVSTRLHSTIFAISNAVPFVDVTHNHKNQNLLETISYEKASLPYRCANSDDLIAAINHSLKEKTDIAGELETIANRQRALLGEITAHVSFL